MRESPCKACPIFSGADLSAVPCDDPCSFLSRYLGQQEGAAERDALRAEVEVLRRALKWTARRADELAAYQPGDSCPLSHEERPNECPENDECYQCVQRQAISEARKGGEG